jgi:hypothetical protein
MVIKTAVTSSIAGLAQGIYPAVRALVIDALGGGVGSTLPTNAYYHATHGFTAGTLQRAIDLLKERQALGILSRGPRGRVVESIDPGQCWQAAGLPPVNLVVPPAGLIETDVLVDEFSAHLTRLGVPYAIHHGHGGHHRLAATSVGQYDLAVVSKATFDVVRPTKLVSDAGLPLFRELAPNTFYGPGRVLVLRRAGEEGTPPRRIAVDRSSPDHVALTNAEFPPSSAYTYVDIVFPRTLAWVLTGKVDAAIWHVTRTDVPISLAGYSTTPMTHESAATPDSDGGRAVLFASPQRPELVSVFHSLPLDNLAAAQHKAIGEELARHKEFFDPAP